jgi:hypothetical protein
MNWNDELQGVLDEMLRKASEDLVGLWMVQACVRLAFPRQTPAFARSATLAIVEKAIADARVVVGGFSGGRFEVWQPQTEVMSRIRGIWADDRDPTLEDNVWLSGPELEYRPARLHSKSPELAERIRDCAPATIDRLVVLAVSLALEAAALPSDLTARALAAAEKPGAWTPELRSELVQIQASCDDEYLDLNDRRGAREPLPPQGLLNFRRARALAAVILAAEGREPLDVADVLYECLAAATDEDAALAAFLEVARGRVSSGE